MARQANKPTPPSENSRTAAAAAAKDATGGEHAPVPATQDPAADPETAHDSGPTEGGSVVGTPTGKLDQDRDGVAETPEVGQEHAPSANKPSPLPADPKGDRLSDSAKTTTDKPGTQEAHDASELKPKRATPQSDQTFEDACEEIGKGIKKLTDAGMGGGEAGKLALQVWAIRNGRRVFSD